MLIATVRVDPGAIALSETFDEVPDLAVRAERIAAHSTKWTMPCVWATADDFDAVEEALAGDSSVDAVVEATEFVGEKYYQIDWSDAVDDRVDSYLDREASILNARGTVDGWRLRIRFATRDQLDRFRRHLRERGHSLELQSLVDPEENRRPLTEVTPSQREALQAASERGYFEVPRQISTRELADELGMSHQNLSKLLRRGTAKLIDQSLETPSTSGDF